MLFIQKLFTDPMSYFIWVFLVIFSVCCHEYAHAQMALWQGDSTASDNGYLTLNPAKQMSLTSLIALLLIGLTWGAVPINPNRFKHKYSEVLVAAAGPLMNLILFVLFSIGGAVVFLKLQDFSASKATLQLCFNGAVLNVVLLIFNLLPVPPLDGWTIFSFLFPHIHRINPEVRNGVIFGLFILAFLFFDKLFLLASYIVINTINIILPLLRSIGI